jgi:hypothetical protein
MDGFRTFQIASGIFLAAYVLGHMNSVFVFARLYFRIDSDWAFATGAPSGLVKDAWNIRLVPHYGLAAFFVLSHLAAGGRTHPRPKHDHADVAFRWLGQTERK